MLVRVLLVTALVAVWASPALSERDVTPQRASLPGDAAIDRPPEAVSDVDARTPDRDDPGFESEVDPGEPCEDYG
ncbi:MAG: hypothetical protein ABIG03_04505 [Candidatus Eisenbacteria bacterium]